MRNRFTFIKSFQISTYKSKLSLDKPLSEALDENMGSSLNCSVNIGGSHKFNMFSIRLGWVPKFAVLSKSSVSIDKNESRSKATSGIQSSLDWKY